MSSPLPIRMLALDLDGTLSQSNHRVLPRTRDALATLHDTGVEVVIATGRRYRTTRFVIDNLGFDVYAVCNGGALVKDDRGATHHEENFSTAQMDSLVDIARALGLSIFGQRDAHSRTGADFIVDDVLDWLPAISKYVRENRQWAGQADLSGQPPEFLVAGVFGEQELLLAYADTIHATHRGTFNTVVVPNHDWGAYYCEVTLSHVDKWTGLGTLLALRGLDASQLCTVGDQLNDIPMLRGAGHSFAMGNGNPALFAHAKSRCGDHDKDGIIDVVRYIEAHNG